MNNDEINKDQEETPSIEGEAADKAKSVPAQRRRRAVKETKQTADLPAEETPDATEREKASSREMLFLKELEKRHRQEDDDDDLNIPNVLPVLPLKDTVVYPVRSAAAGRWSGSLDSPDRRGNARQSPGGAGGAKVG